LAVYNQFFLLEWSVEFSPTFIRFFHSPNQIPYEQSYPLISAGTCPRIGLAGIFGQSRVITGTVKESNGEPIIGASVLVKGTTNRNLYRR
jgi:hypothetical protein